MDVILNTFLKKLAQTLRVFQQAVKLGPGLCQRAVF